MCVFFSSSYFFYAPDRKFVNRSLRGDAGGVLESIGGVPSVPTLWAPPDKGARVLPGPSSDCSQHGILLPCGVRDSNPNKDGSPTPPLRCKASPSPELRGRRRREP